MRRARWMEDLLWGLPGREVDRFLKLPSVSAIEYGEVLGLVDLPLRGATRAQSRPAGASRALAECADPPPVG